MKKQTIGMILISLVMAVATIATADVIGSGFSYQGQLQDGGSFANGNYDVQIEAYSENTGGSSLASEEFTNIMVSNGLFTIPEVDFGDGIYTGDEIWLEISVKLAGAGSYSLLTPRQRVNAVPYAVQADYLGPIGADSGDVLMFNGTDWEPSVPDNNDQWSENGTALTHDGNVGIGTTNPSDRLMVQSDDGEHALRVVVGTTSKLRVLSNGGTTIGLNNTSSTPEDGLYVHGDVKQNESSNGMLKYMLVAQCDAFPTIEREYNGTTAAGTAAITRDGVGRCSIDLPFNTSASFIIAQPLNDIVGVNKTANCISSALDISCKFEESSTGTDTDVFFTLLVY